MRIWGTNKCHHSPITRPCHIFYQETLHCACTRTSVRVSECACLFPLLSPPALIELHFLSLIEGFTVQRCSSVFIGWPVAQLLTSTLITALDIFHQNVELWVANCLCCSIMQFYFLPQTNLKRLTPTGSTWLNVSSVFNPFKLARYCKWWDIRRGK